MVKLAQHIAWSLPIPSKAGKDVTFIENKRRDRVLEDCKPRKTLAQLFESRATSLFPISPSSASAARAEKTPTPLFIRTTSSSSTTSFASASTTSSASATTPKRVKAAASASLSTTLRQPVCPLLLSPTQAHVTFVESDCGKYDKHGHTPAVHQSSELAGGIKRSSSARSIADLSRQEGAFLSSNNAIKTLSISRPLDHSEGSHSPRSPLAIASVSEHSHGSASRNLNRGQNGRLNQILPKKLLFGQEEVHSSLVVANLGKLEQKFRSPFAKFCIHERNQTSFLQNSTDTVESLQNESRFRPIKTDPLIDKGLNAAYAVHNAFKKEKKVRKGLFGLLTDATIGRDHVGDSKVADDSAWKVSGNLEEAANPQCSGHKVQDLKSPSTGLPGNGVAQTNQSSVFLQTDQCPGRKILDNLGMPCKSRESTYTAVEIPDKMVGLAWFDAEPCLLKPGSHSFLSEKFVLEQVVSDRTRYLKHGILHRLYIDEGHLGVAWVDGKAVLLEAGVSVLISPSNKFSYNTTDEKMLSEKEFVLGPFRVVTVDESEVGIKFCNRLPQILYSGRHCLSISKVEVFTGFESLLRRNSYVSEASAISSDNMKVSADACVEWQIKAEDAAAARLANVTDVEEAVCCKVRRAFKLVIWEVNTHDMKLQLTTGVGSMSISDVQLLKSMSTNVLRECQGLFEEGWNVTIWDLQLKHIMILPEVHVIEGNH